MSNVTLEQAAKALYEGDGGRPEIWENIGDELRQTYRDRAAESTDVDIRATNISIGKTSTLLAERRFYDDTYLYSKEGAWLFICDAAVVRGPSGRETVRTKRDVLAFDNAEILLSAVALGGWSEAPLDGNPQWKPTREQVEVETRRSQLAVSMRSAFAALRPEIEAGPEET